MRVFLTYNESLDGIYKSQVICVLKLLQNLGYNFKLVCFISLKRFLKQRNEIKKEYRYSLILPSIPYIRFWKLNRFFLRFFLSKTELIVARGIFATNLAICSNTNNKYKIIYDGRGAITSEQIEYGVYNGTGIENEIFKIERIAVLNSHYRIAVSKKLIEYWKYNFNYQSNDHVVIPSCSNKFFDFDIENFKEKKEIIIIFSGSLSKWHSFDLMIKHFETFLISSKKVKILILSKPNSKFDLLLEKFPKRVSIDWVKPSHVKNILINADYGYVYRESSITNEVASPVKIAEYLSCGLKIIISKNLGDYSELVNNYNLGFNLDIQNTLPLFKVNIKEKFRISKFAKENLSIHSKIIVNKYLNLLNENSLTN